MKKTETSLAAQAIDTSVPSLGAATIDSPLAMRRFMADEPGVSLHMTEDVLPPDLLEAVQGRYVRFQEAGPREKIYFDPPKTKCAVVTCGGLCPGLNDVIRAIVMEAHHNYGVAGTLGIRFGLQGFIPKYGHRIVELKPDVVRDIHNFGGTVLGSSRGHQPPAEIVDALERMNVSILFLIGGDGTMRAAAAIQAEVAKRGLRIGIIGIPKTIDNDISFISRSFGFETAVERAVQAIQCAHTEAISACNGVGVVKVMGRESGFIATHAALAIKEANFVLTPEDPFDLDGEQGFLAALERRVRSRRHAVVVVAEGAGQRFCETTSKTDASGNPVLCDFTTLLIRRVKQRFKERDLPLTLKFIDPSYIIRSVPANTGDRVFCGFLGRHAVHAGFAGKTGMVVSSLQDHFVHLPFHLVTRPRKRIKLDSSYWQALLETTGQSAYAGQPR